jgi:Lipase (class 3)
MATTSVPGGMGAAAAPALAPAIKTDVNTLIQYAMLVELAEAVDPSGTIYTAGATIPITYSTGVNVTYTAVTTFYGNDLATDKNPARGNQIVSFGFVAQDAAGNVVVPIRGTEGIYEWLQDAAFLAVKCPFLPGAGMTEDGFTAVYGSLKTAAGPTGIPLIKALANLPYPRPATSLTICGHSLGGALATLLALDVAANGKFLQPTVYTYASPRTGDPSFADTYNQVVPDTCRVANRFDLVPKVPLPPLYEHVNALFELNPMLRVKMDLICEHHLTSYLYLLSRLGSGPMLPLDACCQGPEKD